MSKVLIDSKQQSPFEDEIYVYDRSPYIYFSTEEEKSFGIMCCFKTVIDSFYKLVKIYDLAVQQKLDKELQKYHHNVYSAFGGEDEKEEDEANQKVLEKKIENALNKCKDCYEALMEDYYLVENEYKNLKETSKQILQFLKDIERVRIVGATCMQATNGEPNINLASCHEIFVNQMES